MFLISKNNWFSKISTSFIYVFLATFPFINYTSFLYFGSVTRSINLILLSSVLVIFLGIFLINKNTKVSFFYSSIIATSFLYVIWISATSFFGIDPNLSFYSVMTRTTGIWYFICLSIFFVLLLNFLKDETKRKKAIFTIVLSSAVFSLLSLFGPEGFSLIFKSVKGDGFTFGNSTFAGMYLFGSFVLSLFLLFSAGKKLWWHFAFPLLLILNPYILNISLGEGKGILSFLGEARASALVLFGSIVVLVLIYFISKIKNFKLKKRLSYGLLTVTYVFIILGAASLFSSDGILRKFYETQATKARLLVWEKSFDLIKERPFMGWGLENFEKTFELNYDSRILQEEYGSEAWFDRAHNVFIDQTFDNGLVGLFIYLTIYIVIGFSMIYVVLNSNKKENQILAIFVLIYTIFHIVELQTAFDTSISYIIVTFMLAVAAIIFYETKKENGSIKEFVLYKNIQYLIGLILITFGIWSLFFRLIPFINFGIVNGEIRKVGSAEKRLSLYEDLFNTPIDLQVVLWRTFTDFQIGVSKDSKVLNDPKKVEMLRKELSVFEEEYRKYTEKHPRDFRALATYANIKIYFMLFGENKLGEAQVILDKAIALVPTAPQPLWMKSVAYLYDQKFDLAREYAKKAVDLNPKVPGSVEVEKYIEDSIKTFPEINLYFFRQI